MVFLFYTSYVSVDLAHHEIFHAKVGNGISIKYTSGCPPVCGDSPRVLASVLCYVHVDKHGISILYHLHQCRSCTSRDSSCLRG